MIRNDIMIDIDVARDRLAALLRTVPVADALANYAEALDEYGHDFDTALDVLSNALLAAGVLPPDTRSHEELSDAEYWAAHAADLRNRTGNHSRTAYPTGRWFDDAENER
jgi:antitoxin component of RelBE/YafQ-DinJ toxin-antitoxin module